jgi:short subunit dehydrogenase-like uncharacterized protein
MSNIIIPPGGFAGAAGMVQGSLGNWRVPGTRRTRTTKSRRKAKRKVAVRKTRRARGTKKNRLIKGSAAAKRYMAKIRRKRRA